MAVESVNANKSTSASTGSGPGNTSNSSSSGGGATKKIDPNSATNEMMGAFLPAMISNQLTMNNQLFNFAKEAIDEADG